MLMPHECRLIRFSRFFHRRHVFADAALYADMSAEHYTDYMMIVFDDSARRGR